MRRKGFTLIELLVTLVILSVGLVSIAASFIRSLEVERRIEDNFSLINSLENKITEIEKDFLRGREVEEIDKVETDGKLRYHIKIDQIEWQDDQEEEEQREDELLYRLVLRINKDGVCQGKGLEVLRYFRKQKEPVSLS